MPQLPKRIGFLINYLRSMYHPRQESGDIQNPEGSAVSPARNSDRWILKIGENLVQASNYHATSSWDNIFIYRIPKCLREAARDDNAYSPQIVSLGPYHHGQDRLRDMEKHKWRALTQMVNRNNQTTKQDYINAVKALEQRARDCYEGPVCACQEHHDDTCSNNFVEMMLLDSCFVLEILFGSIKRFPELGYSKNDPVFAMRGNMHMFRRDMIKLENQIPLFILDTLFSLHTGNPDQKGVVSRLAIKFFDPLTPTYDPCVAFDSLQGRNSVDRSSEPSEELDGLHLLDVFRRNLIGIRKPGNGRQHVAEMRRQNVIPCVTRLKNKGITFQLKRKTEKFWDIQFEDGVLKIPRLLIHNGTKSLFLNLIAYEQCHPHCESEITSYIIFMDNLIDNPEDVTYLYTHGIIEHWLGSDAEVAELFNRMCEEVVYDRYGSYLSVVSGKVNEYHSQRWNRWRSSLKHRYFNNPWSIISFIAAVVLLLLTAAQTFYTLYGYYRQCH